MTAKTGPLGLFALFMVPLVALAGDGKTPPVYHFQPGQELTFHSSSAFKYGEGQNVGEHGTTSDYTVWVVRKNPDGSYRLVLRDKNVFSQTVQGKKTDQPARTTIVFADVFPDGRVLPNKTIQYQGHPGALFPQLPSDAAQTKAGWESVRNEDKITSKPLALAGQFAFESVTDSPFNKIYLSSSKSKATFDEPKGFVTQTDSENTQGYGFKGKGTGKTELLTIKMMDPAALKTFAETTDKYFAAATAYEQKTEVAEKATPEQAKTLLAKAVGDLKAAADGLENKELKTELDQKVAQHKDMEKYYIEGAERRAKLMGKPAAEFEAKSMDGKTVKLADLRGQVVVLDFWYRGCGWCIRAMPQMNELAADFADKPVSIFGMNTDRNEEDAKFVIEKMGLKYATLKAEGLPQRFSVQGFPTLIIIDQQGKVHDIHVGYSPTLREEVGKQIKELLAKR